MYDYQIALLTRVPFIGGLVTVSLSAIVEHSKYNTDMDMGWNGCSIGVCMTSGKKEVSLKE